MVSHDGVTQMLAEQINAGIAQINEGNEILLSAEDSETGNRDIDKLFKDEKVENEKAVKAYKKAQDLREKFRAAVNEYRNVYRTEVLGEEEKADTPDVDKDALKEVRTTVLSAIKLAIDYARSNNKQDVVKWAESISVPQVGRQGSSTAGGVKKPRAYVKFNDSVYESFGEAAKALTSTLSTEDNKVEVTSPILVQAWVDAGESETFDFHGVKVTVTPKEKKSDSKAA